MARIKARVVVKLPSSLSRSSGLNFFASIPRRSGEARPTVEASAWNNRSRSRGSLVERELKLVLLERRM